MPRPKWPFTTSHCLRHHIISLLLLCLQQTTRVVLALNKKATTLLWRGIGLDHTDRNGHCCPPSGSQVFLQAHRTIPSLPVCLWTFLKLRDKFNCPSSQSTLRILIHASSENHHFQNPQLDQGFSRCSSFLFKFLEGLHLKTYFNILQ